MPNMGKKNNRSRKGKGKKNKGSALLPCVTAIPSAKRILMTYSTNNTIVEAAAGTGTATFYRLNSVYDPDASGVGTVCAGYSTWAALFYNYRVSRVTVRAVLFGQGSTGGVINLTVLPVPGQAVLPTNPVLWRSGRGATHTTVVPQADGGKNSMSHTRTYDIARWLGVSKQQYLSDMDFSGAVGSNPLRQLYFAVTVNSCMGSTPARVVFQLDITYEVEWFNPVVMQL